MKSFAIAILFSALACAQTPPATPARPAAPPQAAPPPAVAPDAIVAEVDGKKLTASDVDKLISSLPPQFQQAGRVQPAQTLQQILMMKYFADEAEKAHLDKQSPYKEALEFGRMQYLSTMELSVYKARISVTPEELERVYKENPDRFRQAKVRVIHLSFSPTPDKPGPDGNKMLSEAEAKAKADDLRKQILAGADFGKLARENSDDKASAAKDGDFGVVTRASSYPEPVKATVFALKAGEVSEPVKQPNGFYLIRVDSFTAQTLDEVRPQISEELRQSRFNDWMQGIQTRYTVKIENPAYFSPKQPLQLQQVR